MKNGGKKARLDGVGFLEVEKEGWVKKLGWERLSPTRGTFTNK